MTSKIVVNNIEADSGINTITFVNEVTAPTFNGNITGTAATFTTGTFSGNVDIAGALTYEDVTNVDSVGIVTARSGIHVTGGSVGIGTDNPETKLNIVGSTASTSSSGGTLGIRQKGNTNNDGITLTSSHANSARFWKDSDGKLHIYNTGTGSNQFVLDNAGRTGIGTDNPSVKLHVHGGKIRATNTEKTNFTELGIDGNIEIKRNSGGAYIDFADDTTEDYDVRIQEESNGLRFITGGSGSTSEKLRLTSDGDLFVAGTGGMNTTQLPNGSTINVNGTSSNDGLSVIRYSTGYGAYGLNIGRSKSDTLGTNAAVTNGNDLGHITFYGADGTDFNEAAAITATVDGTPSDGTNMPGRLVFKTSSDGSATPTERLRITSGGEVNIGNNLTQTTYLSEISGPYNKAGLRVVSGAPNYEDPFVVATATGGERFRITGDGNVGVGTAVPQTGIDLRVSDGSYNKTMQDANDNAPHMIVRNRNGTIRYFEYYFNCVKNTNSGSIDKNILDITNMGNFFQGAFEVVYGTRIQAVSDATTSACKKLFGINKFNQGNVAITDSDDIDVDSNSNTHTNVQFVTTGGSSVRLKVTFSSTSNASSFCSGVVRGWGVNDSMDDSGSGYSRLVFYNGGG